VTQRGDNKCQQTVNGYVCSSVRSVRETRAQTKHFSMWGKPRLFNFLLLWMDW